MGNAAAEPLRTGDLVRVEELHEKRTVNNPAAGTVSDIADDHDGFSPNGMMESPDYMKPCPDGHTFIVHRTHLLMVIN